jgi:hypothetical protein
MSAKPEGRIYTTIAIGAYLTVRRRELSVARAEKALSAAVSNIPQEDLTYYVEKTNGIDDEYDRRLERVEAYVERQIQAMTKRKVPKR